MTKYKKITGIEVKSIARNNADRICRQILILTHMKTYLTGEYAKGLENDLGYSHITLYINYKDKSSFDQYLSAIFETEDLSKYTTPYDTEYTFSIPNFTLFCSKIFNREYTTSEIIENLFEKKFYFIPNIPYRSTKKELAKKLVQFILNSKLIAKNTLTSSFCCIQTSGKNIHVYFILKNINTKQTEHIKQKLNENLLPCKEVYSYPIGYTNYTTIQFILNNNDLNNLNTFFKLMNIKVDYNTIDKCILYKI